jgi:hypothetical protein
MPYWPGTEIKLDNNGKVKDMSDFFDEAYWKDYTSISTKIMEV